MCEPPSSQINRLKIIERNNLPFLVHSFSIRNLVRSFGVDAFQRGSKRKMLMKEKREEKKNHNHLIHCHEMSENELCFFLLFPLNPPPSFLVTKSPGCSC